MTAFKIHTPETAPEKSRELLQAVHAKMGFVPNVIGELADSPAALKGYLELSDAARSGVLSPVEREIVHMSVSWLNDCGYCVAAHSMMAEKSGVAKDVIEALRHDKPLADVRHEALRQFTRIVMKKMGRPDQVDMDAFFAAGWMPAHVMEVVLNISLATLTNYTNHIARTPLDKPFEAHRFEEGKRSPSIDRKSCAA